MSAVTEAWQNQRHYGITWRSPALLERAHWSDAQGNPVQFERTQSPRHCPESWEPVVTISTDPDGYQYASVFKHFDYAREGGRASQRAADFVRRRLWRKKAGPSDTSAIEQGKAGAGKHAAASVTDALISPTTVMFGARVRKETETERRKSVVRIFVGMFAGCIKRHQIWNVVPWDPGAWWVMYNQHQAALLELQQNNMHHQIDLKALSEPVDQSQPNAADKLCEDDEQRPTLVRELLCAAIHSRAAYGYAMAAGHMSNLVNFALMHTVHQISFDAAGGASAEANNLAVAQLAGLDPSDVIMGEWSNSVMRPCHYIAADKANHCIILAIRGSLEVGDVLSDLSANPMELSLLGVQGKVHEGMMGAATFVHCNSAAALESVAQTHPGWPLVVTGHSMGGGVAAIVAALLRDGTAPIGLGPVRCCVISPAAVFSGDLSEACRPFITSLILRSDAVPRLSYASVEGVFVELVGASPVRRAANDVKYRVEQILAGLKMDWIFQKPALAGRPSNEGHHGLNTVSPLLDDDEAVSAASHAAMQAYAHTHSRPDRSKALKIGKADSPQRRRGSPDTLKGIVDAAQFAEDMVPEALHKAALSRNPSQTSLSGAAPGGVLDAGLQGAALPRKASHVTLSEASPGSGSDPDLAHLSPSAAQAQASQANADPGAGHVPEEPSGFRWPWQSRAKPGGAVRQQQPWKALSSNPGRTAAKTSGRSGEPQLCSGITFAGSQHQQPNVMDQTNTTELHQPMQHSNPHGQLASAIGTSGPEGRASQASGLADKAVSRIAAAQHAMSSSPSNSHRVVLSDSRLGSSPEVRAHGGSPLRKSNGTVNSVSPGSPTAGAVSSPSSPQHNSRLRSRAATSGQLRQLIEDAKVQRQDSGRESELAQSMGQDAAAGQGPSVQTDQPSPHAPGSYLSSSSRSGVLLGQGPSVKAGKDYLGRQGSAAQPQGNCNDGLAEGREHAGNPGSQAAALHSAASRSKDSSQAQRKQEEVADMLGITRLEPDGPPAPLYPPGRILWMLPPPEQPSSQDAHIAVADPDDAQHPEESPSSSLVFQQHAASVPSEQHQSSVDAVSAAEGSEEVQKVWQAQPILLDVQKECFSRLLLLPELLMDHLPDTYLAAVQQL
ncbi:hypothetical protein WJX77_003190 [Trebouxia sp. C0004]